MLEAYFFFQFLDCTLIIYINHVLLPTFLLWLNLSSAEECWVIICNLADQNHEVSPTSQWFKCEIKEVMENNSYLN